MMEQYKKEIEKIKADQSLKDQTIRKIHQQPSHTKYILGMIVICSVILIAVISKVNKQVSHYSSPVIVDHTIDLPEIYESFPQEQYTVTKEEIWDEYYSSFELGTNWRHYETVADLKNSIVYDKNNVHGTLPIYINPYYQTWDEENQLAVFSHLTITNSYIKSVLTEYASRLQMDHYEISYNDILKAFILFNEDIEITFYKNSPESIVIRFNNSYYNDDNQFDLLADNEEDATAKIDQFYQYYKDLFQLDSVKYQCNLMGGRYYEYSIIDTSSSVENSILSSSLYRIIVYKSDKEGQYNIIIPLNNIDRYKIKEEEIIDENEAIYYFREGSYINSIESQIEKCKTVTIADIQLTYRYCQYKKEFILPYYVIYVPSIDWDIDQSMLEHYPEEYCNSYSMIIVPALKKAYE